MQKSTGGQFDVLQLVMELLNKLSQEEFELFFVQAWLLWNQRNPVTHGGGIQEPSRLVRRAVKLLEEFEEAQQLLGV